MHPGRQFKQSQMEPDGVERRESIPHRDQPMWNDMFLVSPGSTLAADRMARSNCARRARTSRQSRAHMVSNSWLRAYVAVLQDHGGDSESQGVVAIEAVREEIPTKIKSLERPRDLLSDLVLCASVLDAR